MAIPAGDLTKLRGKNIIVTPHLNVTPKVAIGTATVASGTWGTIGITGAALAAGLTVDTLPVGSMVWVGTAAGGHDVFTSSIRKVVSGVTTVLYCHGSTGGGDPGVAVTEPVALAAGQHVTIFANLPLWAQLSRVYNSTFYKAYDVAYTDQGSDPAPVCNIGKWRRLELTTGGSVDLILTAANSIAWGAKSVDSWTWDARNSAYASMTGVTVVAGAGTATATFRFTTAGFYMLSCTITDDGAGNHSHIAYCYVWVVDKTNYDDLHGWRVEDDQQDRTGRRMTIVMEGDVAESVVYPGAAFLYSETSTYNGGTLTDGSVVDTFVGFIDEEIGIREIEQGRVRFTIVSPSYVLDQLPMASQYIEETASPANWTQVTSDLSNPNGIAWYVLAHHAPNMLKLFDFRQSLGDTLRNHIWTLNNSSVWGQLREITPEQINIGCASEGALFVRDDPLIEDDTYRDALDVAMTWLVGDLRGDDPLEYRRRYRLKVGQVDAYAFAYNGSNTIPLRATAPWTFQVEGTDKRVYNGLVTPYTTVAADIARIAGHLFARLNTPYQDIALHAMRNFDTADPARMIWHKITLAAAYDPRGTGWTDQRVLPRSVTRRWQQVGGGEWLKTVDITVEVETAGQPGIFRPVEYNQDGAWNPINDWLDLGDIVVTEPDPPAPESGPLYLLAAAYGAAEVARAYSSTGYEGGTPVWEDISTGLSGAMRWMTADPFNYKRYYAVGTAGLFVCEDITATTPLWVQILDTSRLPTALASFGYHQVVMTPHRQGWIGLCNTTDYIDISLDGGNTWQTTFYETELANINFLCNLQVSPFSTESENTVWFRQAGNLYRSTDWGLNWTKIATHTQMGFTETTVGAVTVPLFRPDGTLNPPDVNQRVYVISGLRVIFPDKGANLALSNARGIVGSWSQLLAPTGLGDWGGWPAPAIRSLVSSTQNGTHIGMVQRETAGTSWRTQFAYSTNSGVTWTASANQPSYPTGINVGVGLNGWPYDDNIFITWWATSVGGASGGLYLTYDKGASAWQNAIGNLITGGIFTDSRIAYAELLLAGVQ